MTFATCGLNLGAGGSAEGMGMHHQTVTQLSIGQNLNSLEATTGSSRFAKHLLVHHGPRGKLRQDPDIDWKVVDPMTGIVETPLGDSTNERHLATFEAHAESAAGTSRLTLAAATRGAAQTTGFTVTNPLGSGFGARPIG